MKKILLTWIFLNLHSDNHKNLTFFGCFPLDIYLNNLENQILDENLQNDFATGKADSKELPDIYSMAKGTIFSYSFDEVSENIYAGFSILFNCKIDQFSKTGSGNSINSCYITRYMPIGFGGYLQYQDEENEDYNLFIRITGLIGPEKVGLKKLAKTGDKKDQSNDLVNNKLFFDKDLHCPYTIGGLGLLQFGYKLDFIEISFTAGLNIAGQTSISYKGSKEQKINNTTIFFGISIGYILK